MRRILLYLGQAVVLGLALAFVLTQLWPSLTDAPQTPAPVVAPAVTPVAAVPAPAIVAPTTGNQVSFAPAVHAAAPAVVNVNTAKVVTVRRNPFADDPFLQQFFGPGLERFGTPQRQIQNSLGSGVIMRADGYIVTNHHVIDGADAVQVSLQDGRTADARIIGTDPETDIAVLKIDLKNLPVIQVGHPEQLQVGDVVLAIGNPFGVGQTVTMGIVSATGRNKLGINTFENYIQTDAAINPGNSGGALVDANGRLIGINTAIFSRSGGSMGIGFAIPANFADAVLDDIVRHGRPLRGWLGIEAQPLTEEIARVLGIKRVDGMVVTGVYRSGPADRAGLKPGDVIVAVDGEPVTAVRQLLLAISRHRPGGTLRLKIVRQGDTHELTATAGERPPASPTSR